MHSLSPTHLLIWTIAALVTLGIVVRPWRLPEAVWAVAGALLLVAGALLPPSQASAAVRSGTNVYMFLLGMMLLAEVARHHGLFDWIAAVAAGHAQGSAWRLFVLVYLVGVVVTVLLSNDATAVVLTPAVYTVARTARAPPLPYLYICAFVANAASFVLPISNPANLVVFGNHLPSLGDWMTQFGWPSLAAIAATFAVLGATQRRWLRERVATVRQIPRLSASGRVAAVGVLATAVLLVTVSAVSIPLGAPALVAGAVTLLLAQWRVRQAPWSLLRSIPWSVLPLVAGLFVLVAGLDRTGILRRLGTIVADSAQHSRVMAVWGVGIAVAGICNLANNLPVALTAGRLLQSLSSAAAPVVAGASAVAVHGTLANAVLIGVDLGPNLSVTGSLASILWLTALRREGQQVSAWTFLALGACVVTPALLASLAVVWLRG
jgi:arsenical pump membrane protein